MLLCSVHQNDLVPATCSVCKHMTHIIKGDMAKQLVVDGTVIPTASERLLRKRSDQTEVTLTFTEEELALADKIYSQGMFKRGHFDELAKKFLFLPPEQNRLLGQNIETEDLFKPYEHESRYQHIFKYKNQVLSVLRQLRISTRPLVLALSHATELARHVRKSGEKFGYTYPEVAPEVQLKGPTPVLDYLSRGGEKVDGFLQLPHIMDPASGVTLDNMAASLVKANHETNLTALQGYHEKVSKAILNFYDGVVKSSLSIFNI